MMLFMTDQRPTDSPFGEFHILQGGTNLVRLLSFEWNESQAHRSLLPEVFVEEH
jgi:hypothetical protein